MKHKRLGIELGFQIPPNVFDYGLRIGHFGGIAINPGVKIGKFCEIRQNVTIGIDLLTKSCPVSGELL